MTTLLLHGLGASRDIMLDQFGPVLDAGERVIAPDQRAHGGHPLVGGPEQLRISAMATELADQLLTGRYIEGADSGYLDQHEPVNPREPLTIIGTSMGAAIALRLALQGPFTVTRAVFVRPAFTEQPNPANLHVFAEIADLVREHGLEEAERRFRQTDSWAAFVAESPASADGLATQFHDDRAAARIDRLSEIPKSTAFSSPEELSSLSIPTLVLGAPRDPVHPVTIAELWAHAIPGAQYELLPARDDGYPAQLARMREVVGAFLAQDAAASERA